MSFPKYDAYKGSKDDWLGDIPANWDVWKLGHAFPRIGSGTTPKSDNPKYYDDGTIPWVNTGDLNDGALIECGKCITAKAVEDHSTLKLYPNGSLLFAMYGATIGKLGLLQFPATVNQACCVFSGESPITVEFLFYWFIGLRQKILSLATGGGQPNVSQDILRTLRVACPSKNEQRTITSFLSQETAKIDALIAEQRRLIELLKEKRQAVISHAVTKGLDPNVPMKPSGVQWLGDVPEHWEVSSLRHFATFYTGSTPARDNPDYWNGTIPWVKTGEINYTLITETEETITQHGLNSSSCSIAPPGTLLMALYGQGVTRGRVAILGIFAAFNQACVAITVDDRISNLFLHTFFVFAYPYIRDMGNETTQMNMNVEFVRRIRIVVPPLNEQIAITDYVVSQSKKFDSLTSEAERAIGLLQERRAALICAAVTGKIDVRGFAPQETPLTRTPKSHDLERGNR